MLLEAHQLQALVQRKCASPVWVAASLLSCLPESRRYRACLEHAVGAGEGATLLRSTTRAKLPCPRLCCHGRSAMLCIPAGPLQTAARGLNFLGGTNHLSTNCITTPISYAGAHKVWHSSAGPLGQPLYQCCREQRVRGSPLETPLCCCPSWHRTGIFLPSPCSALQQLGSCLTYAWLAPCPTFWFSQTGLCA